MSLLDKVSTCTIGFIFLFNFSSSKAQSSNNFVNEFWAQSSVAHVDFKILERKIPTVKSKRGEIGLMGGIALKINGIEDRIDLNQDALEMRIFGDEVLVIQLMETLGGEFTIGDLDNRTSKKINYNFGLSGGGYILDNLLLGVDLSFWGSEVGSTFPVTIIENGSTGISTRTISGEFMSKVKGFNALLDANYYFSTRIVRPFLGGGLGIGLLGFYDSHIIISDTEIPIEKSKNDIAFVGQAKIGARFVLGQLFFLDVGSSYIFESTKTIRPIHFPTLYLKLNLKVGK